MDDLLAHSAHGGDCDAHTESVSATLPPSHNFTAPFIEPMNANEQNVSHMSAIVHDSETTSPPSNSSESTMHSAEDTNPSWRIPVQPSCTLENEFRETFPRRLCALCARLHVGSPSGLAFQNLNSLASHISRTTISRRQLEEKNGPSCYRGGKFSIPDQECIFLTVIQIGRIRYWRCPFLTGRVRDEPSDGEG